jgi:hypothetical protein
VVAMLFTGVVCRPGRLGQRWRRYMLRRFPGKDYRDTQPDRRGWRNVLGSLVAVALTVLGELPVSRFAVCAALRAGCRRSVGNLCAGAQCHRSGAF